MKRTRQKLIVLTGVITIMLLAFPLAVLCQEQEIDDGIAWLIANQDTDSGSWGIDKIRDTATVVEVFSRLDETGAVYNAGVTFLEGEETELADRLSRKIAALLLSGSDVSNDVDRLIGFQNDDGGFGYAEGFPSSIIDTLLAAKALAAAGIDDDEIIGKMLEYIKGRQNDDGSFGFAGGEDGNLYLTALAVPILKVFQPEYNLTNTIDNAIEYILYFKQTDHGFGQAESSALETAVSVLALIAAEEYNTVLLSRDYLASVQQSNGSWEDDIYTTAVALWALDGAADVDKPNLRIESASISITPANPVEGQTVTINCMVDNNGTVAAEDVKVNFILYNPTNGILQLLGYDTISVVYPSESVEVELSWLLESTGSRMIIVYADQVKQIDEINEDHEDNSGARTITFGTAPDLAISAADLRFDNTSPASGETFTLSADIHNNGEGESGNVTIQLYDGDPQTGGEMLIEDTFSSIPGGRYSTATFELALLAGTYNLYVQVDPDNTIDEASEDNNLAYRTITVLPTGVEGKDLAVLDGNISFSNQYPHAGESLTVTCTVVNNGTEDAENVTAAVYDGVPGVNTLIGSASTDIIRARKGGEFNFDITNGLSEGDHEIYVVVDPGDAITETSEDNNSGHKTLTVLNEEITVDVAISADGVWFENPAPPQNPGSDVGDTVDIRWVLENNSSITLQNIKFGMYEGGHPDDGGKLLFEDIIQSLGSGTTMDMRITRDTAYWGGMHEIFMVVDPDHAISEDDETNNSASEWLKVSSPYTVDLVLTNDDIVIVTENPAVGSYITVDCTVHNVGTTDITDHFDIAFYDGDPRDGSGKKFKVVEYLNGLGAGAEATVPVTFLADLLAGAARLYVVADPPVGDFSGEIDEINEFNNLGWKDVAVAAPDLEVTTADISFNPGAPMSGDTFTMTVDVRNVGAVNSYATTIAVYDGDPAGGHKLVENLLPGIGAGDNELVEFNLVLHAAGAHSLYVRIEPKSEMSEANNQASAGIFIASCEGDGDCGDADPCTDDSCVDGNCVISPVDCNDDNSCTTDTCDPDNGCMNTPISDDCEPGLHLICVPWQGDVDKYHTALSGESVTLKAVIETNSDTDNISYKWDFGDGEDTDFFGISGSQEYNVEINHTYTGAPGTPFIARLIATGATTGNGEDTYRIKIREDNLDSRANVAIDDGLWYLYKNSISSDLHRSLIGEEVTVWDSTYPYYYASSTASARKPA